jgi:hypothetical protein|mmetsp:Transcript_65052/g.108999  ORF Transcript_65052/g.108999 Transcript_65052/m.108999 type:complete len:145 (+) Transcript_65052:655-1089(+)
MLTYQPTLPALPTGPATIPPHICQGPHTQLQFGYKECAFHGPVALRQKCVVAGVVHDDALCSPGSSHIAQGICRPGANMDTETKTQSETDGQWQERDVGAGKAAFRSCPEPNVPTRAWADVLACRCRLVWSVSVWNVISALLTV